MACATLFAPERGSPLSTTVLKASWASLKLASQGKPFVEEEEEVEAAEVAFDVEGDARRTEEEEEVLLCPLRHSSMVAALVFVGVVRVWQRFLPPPRELLACDMKQEGAICRYCQLASSTFPRYASLSLSLSLSLSPSRPAYY